MLWLGALLRLALGVVVILAGFPAGLAATPEIQQRVTTVGCPSNDQMGRAMQTAELMPAPIEQNLAEQLDYYQGEDSPGVFAPKGWSCRAWYGSTGMLLLVTPTC